MTHDQHEADCYLREAADLRIALGIAPGAPLAAEPLGNGEHNANFSFAHPDTGERYVLRINYASQIGLADQAQYEHHALEVLEPSGRTPRPLFVDDTRAIIDRGVLVIEFCPGEHLSYDRAHDLREAARSLADIHSVRVPADSRLLRPERPMRALLEECLAMYRIYRGSALAESYVTEYLDGFAARCARIVDEQGDPVDDTHVVSTECIAAHFLIPADGGPAHVVDWEKPIVGEAAHDVAYFLAPTTTFWDSDFIFSPGQRAAFVDDYLRAVDGRFATDRFRERFEAYLPLICLRGTTWCAMAQVEYRDPERPLKNEKTFRKIQDYLSPAYLERVRREHFSGN